MEATPPTEMIRTKKAERGSIDPVSPPKSVPPTDQSSGTPPPARTSEARITPHRAPTETSPRAVQALQRSGAAKIAALTQSYIDNPPSAMDGSKVVRVRNFANGDLLDAEGDPIPAEKMLFFDLEDGRSFAVRPSGTEPKIKYYLFAHGAPGVEPEVSRPVVEASIDALWKAVAADAAERSR